MKKQITLFVATLFSFLSISQETKQFKGNFQDGLVDPGQATYQYYEKNGEIIKNGLFTYNRLSKSDDGSYSTKISGNFKNGLRDGKWTFSITFNDWNNGTGNYVTGSISLSSSYINGLPDNQWIYTENSKSRIKNNTINGFVWSSFTSPQSSKAVVNFKNGILNGELIFENLLVTDNIKCFFNENGFVTNSLSIQYSPVYNSKADIEYYKNIMIKYTELSDRDGFKNNLKLSQEDILLIQAVADKGVPKDDLAKNRIKLDTVQLITLNDFKSNIYNELFINEYIQGDLVYNGENKFGGMHILTTKHELMKLSEIPEIEQAYFYMKDTTNITRVQEAKIRLEKIRNSFSNNLSAIDLKELDQKIINCSNIIKNEYSARELKKEKDFELSNLLNFRSIEYKAIVPKLLEINEFKLKYNSVLTPSDNEKINTKIENLNNLALEWKNQISKNVDNQFISKQINSSTAKIENVIAKEPIYFAFEKIKLDYFSKIEQSKNNLEVVINLSEELEKISDRVIKLLNEDTKTLEKELKKALKSESSVETFKSLIGN